MQLNKAVWPQFAMQVFGRADSTPVGGGGIGGYRVIGL